MSPIDNQKDEKQFYLLNHFPEKKVKTGLEKESVQTWGQNPEMVLFFAFCHGLENGPDEKREKMFA